MPPQDTILPDEAGGGVSAGPTSDWGFALESNDNDDDDENEYEHDEFEDVDENDMSMVNKSINHGMTTTTVKPPQYSSLPSPNTLGGHSSIQHQRKLVPSNVSNSIQHGSGSNVGHSADNYVSHSGRDNSKHVMSSLPSL